RHVYSGRPGVYRHFVARGSSIAAIRSGADRGLYMYLLRLPTSEEALQDWCGLYHALLSAASSFGDTAVLGSAYDEHGVRPAKRERIRQCVLELRRFATLAGHAVEVAVGIGHGEISGGRQAALFQRERGDCEFQRAGRSH